MRLCGLDERLSVGFLAQCPQSQTHTGKPELRQQEYESQGGAREKEPYSVEPDSKIFNFFMSYNFLCYLADWLT